MLDDQEAFDEAFNELIIEHTLDVVIDKLREVGVVVHPEQRMVVGRWLVESDDRLPLPIRLFRLMSMLRSS